MKLAILQVIAGILIIGLLVWFIGWVEPDNGSITRVFEGIEVELYPPTGWNALLLTWKVSSFILGVAVLSCGVIQYLRERRQALI